MRDFLELVPRLLAALTFAVLVVTILHEYGYFFIVGAHLQTIATTYDYFTNALLWLPSTLGIVTYIQILEQNISIEGKSIHLGKLFYLNWFAPLLGLSLAFFFGGYLAASVAWFLAFASVFILSKLISVEWVSKQWTLRRLVLTLPFVAIASFSYGISSGYSDLRKVDDIYSIAYKETDLPSHRVVLLRSFDKGLLVRDAIASQISFIRWDVVASLNRFIPPKEISLSCRWFGVACGKTRAVAP